MSMKRGDRIYLADGVHEVVGVEPDAVFIERLGDQSIIKYTLIEAETLVEQSKKNGWYTGPWPFTVIDHIHGEDWSLDDKFIEMGLSEKDRGMFKYPVHTLKVNLEIHRNGDVFILAINDEPLAEKIKNS